MSTDGPLYPGHPSLEPADEYLCSLDGCDITHQGCNTFYAYYGPYIGEWASYDRRGWHDEARRDLLPESVIQMTEALWKLHS